jgi:hypothetical protein
MNKHFAPLLVCLLIAAASCGSSSGPPQGECANDCSLGDVSCTGGILSTCQNVNGCIEYKMSSTCPSGECQDASNCAMPASCASLTTCDTCAAPMTIDCFWCPTTSTCTLTPDQTCPNAITGDNFASLCAQAASCAPCDVSNVGLCDDTEFECTCGTGKTPGDKSCVVDTGAEYCCSS